MDREKQTLIFKNSTHTHTYTQAHVHTYTQRDAYSDTQAYAQTTHTRTLPNENVPS